MLIDSNILVYSINRRSPKQKSARQFLKNNQDNLILAHQNILETLRVLTHPKFPHPMSSKSAIRAVLNIAKNCQIIIPKVGSEFIALELIKNYQLSGNRIFDAYLVATALSNDVLEIATDNVRDFKRFEQIQVVNPFNK